MKHTTILLILATFVVASCSNNPSKKVKAENVATADQSAQSTNDMPVMTFDKTDHDFGTINEGETVETVFNFTNTGSSDLIITNAKGSCGCTVPEYPKNTPIKPGESASIKVKFDSSNKPNLQSKTVTITANTAKAREQIRIKTFVTPRSCQTTTTRRTNEGQTTITTTKPINLINLKNKHGSIFRSVTLFIDDVCRHLFLYDFTSSKASKKRKKLCYKPQERRSSNYQKWYSR